MERGAAHEEQHGAFRHDGQRGGRWGAGLHEQSVTPSGRGRRAEDHMPLPRYVRSGWSARDDDLVHGCVKPQRAFLIGIARNISLLALARERDQVMPARLNETWALDFMTDALYDGRRFRTFNVLDEGNREALAIEIGTSIPSALVIRVLDDLIRL